MMYQQVLNVKSNYEEIHALKYKRTHTFVRLNDYLSIKKLRKVI